MSEYIFMRKFLLSCAVGLNLTSYTLFASKGMVGMAALVLVLFVASLYLLSIQE